MKKNIVLFTVSYPYGDKEQFLETEIQYLSENFNRVTIIPTFINGDKRETQENIVVDTGFAQQSNTLQFAFSSLLTKYTYKDIIHHPSILFSLKKLLKLISFTGRGIALFKYLKKNFGKNNIFYSYWFNGTVFASYLYDQKIANIVFVTRVHRNDLYLEENGGYLPLRSTVLKDIKKIFPISQNGYDYLLEHYPLDNRQVSLSKLGTKDQDISTKASKDPKDFYIVSCSHISPVKRVDMIIESVAKCAQKNPSITFYWTHIGAGKEYDKIKSFAHEVLPINVKTNFLGNLGNTSVFNFYKHYFVDLFINTSISEGIPVTFMEAMSCSIPVMAIDVGGVSEIVNNKNGILLDKQSSCDTIAEELHHLVNNKVSLVEKKNNARKTWKKYYNAKYNYKEFAKILYEL